MITRSGKVPFLVNLPVGFGALKVTTAHFSDRVANRPRIGRCGRHCGGVRFNTNDYGERHQPYALPPKTITSFRGDEINSAQTKWRSVSDNEVKALTAKSTDRQKTNKELLKVKKDLAKSAKTKGTITIAEILDDPERSKKDEDDEDEDEKKLSPQTLEALQVLADLVAGRR